MFMHVNLTAKISGQVTSPSSKSQSIRGLILALLADGESTLINPLDSADMQDAIRVCKQLGAEINIYKDKLLVKSKGFPFKTPIEKINTGNSGITTRFIMPLLGLRENVQTPVILDCGEQMRARPIHSLVAALRLVGLSIDYLGKEGQLPVSITGRLLGGTTQVEGLTSQYLSALLIALPCASGDSKISVENLHERPYMELTLNWLKEQNINYHHLGSVDNSSASPSPSRRPAACPRDPEILLSSQADCIETDQTGSRGQAAGSRDLNYAGRRDLNYARHRDLNYAGHRDLNYAGHRGLNYGGRRDLNYAGRRGLNYGGRRDYDTFQIAGKQRYKPFHSTIAGDFSSASYLIAAGVLTPGEISILGLNIQDPQGDKRLVSILQDMGADIKIEPTRLLINGGRPLHGIQIDANDIPDLLPTLAVIGTYATGKTHIVNVKQARIKETDRIHSMTDGLRRLGAKIEEYDDGMIVYQSALQGTLVKGYNDHRTVMALAIAGLLAEGRTVIDDCQAINKTFPTFVDLMQTLGARMEIKHEPS